MGESIRCIHATIPAPNFPNRRTTCKPGRLSVSPLLPEVENPIPEAIGLGTLLGIAGTASMLSIVISTVLGLPETQRNRWIGWGTVIGFLLGAAIYLTALLAQLLCRQ